MAQRNLIEEAMQAASEQSAAPEAGLDILAEMEKARAERVSARTRVYVVQAGDTLGGIAAALYGDASRWNEIFEANRGTLNDPNLIQVGQELQIP
jgi:nucleoid-associated protein YgaU